MKRSWLHGNRQTRKIGDLKVHIMHHGSCLCGLDGTPPEWPDGHVFVPLRQHGLSNCIACLVAAERMDDGPAVKSKK